MNFEYVEVELHLDEVLKFLKDKKDCLVAVELEDDSTVKCYTYPINAQGYNPIIQFELYYKDYAECNCDDIQYKEWLESCFVWCMTAKKDGIEHVIKVELN